MLPVGSPAYFSGHAMSREADRIVAAIAASRADVVHGAVLAVQ